MQRIFIVSTRGGMDIWGAYSTKELAEKATQEAKRMHWNQYAKWSIEAINLDPVISDDSNTANASPAGQFRRRKP